MRASECESIIRDLCDAIYGIERTWESGDLAGAVRYAHETREGALADIEDIPE